MCAKRICDLTCCGRTHWKTFRELCSRSSFRWKKSNSEKKSSHSIPWQSFPGCVHNTFTDTPNDGSSLHSPRSKPCFLIQVSQGIVPGHQHEDSWMSVRNTGLCILLDPETPAQGLGTYLPSHSHLWVCTLRAVCCHPPTLHPQESHTCASGKLNTHLFFTQCNPV